MKKRSVPWCAAVMNTTLFDDQFIIYYGEHKLQLGVHKLNQICGEYNMKIATNKRKVIALKIAKYVRSKTVVHSKTTEQI